MLNIIIWCEEEIILAAATCVVVSGIQRKRCKRKYWVWSSLRERIEYQRTRLVAPLIRDDQFTVSGNITNFLCISYSNFHILHTTIEPFIRKKDTNFRISIPPMERLIVTLRFIDIKDPYQSLSYPFKMSKQVISKIIPDVCDALNKVWLTKTTDYY